MFGEEGMVRCCDYVGLFVWGYIFDYLVDWVEFRVGVVGM